MSGLSGMTLERLNLTGYSDISPLQNLCSLSSLSVGLSRYPVDFSSLQELGILELNLTGLGSNVDPDSVASITTLQSLQVSDEGLHDISALIQMPALTQMVLWVSPNNSPETDLKTLNLAESAWLNELTTSIPVEQLEQFLQQENRTIRFMRRAE